MKYREAYPNSLSSGHGLISELSSYPDTPWSDVIAADVERLYSVRSGFKDIIETFLLVPEQNRAALLAALYSEKWTKLWDLFKLSYNPLDAYRMRETEIGTKTVQSTRKSEYGKGVVEVSNGSSTENYGSGVYGFNSENSVPSDTGTTGGSTNSRNEITNSGEDNHTGNSTDTDNRTIEKSGNIGYSTPQELIRQEFEIWGTAFFNIIFEDIDQFITLQVY